MVGNRMGAEQEEEEKDSEYHCHSIGGEMEDTKERILWVL